MHTYLILENIRSAHNVGAMFRTAEGAGVSKIFLCGYTPTPVDRYGRTQPEIGKTSLGAAALVPWEQVVTVEVLVRRLQSDGVTVVAVEKTEAAESLATFTQTQDTAYLVGNEVLGVSADSLAMADQVVCVPMLGQKESLNVATVAGIVMYHGLLQT
jgi:tRNA G18 (ribose-2'-O)-methylase SpoU